MQGLELLIEHNSCSPEGRDHYRKVVLHVDVMKVNKILFLITISRAIKFGMVAFLKNATIVTILESIKDVRNIYMKRGFTLENIEVDRQFEPLQGELTPMGITLNKCSREELVLMVEQHIRTLKQTMPMHYKYPPLQEAIRTVGGTNGEHMQFLVKHRYPLTDGISRNINPRELMTGTKIDYNKHIHAEFGEYVQVIEEHDNSMNTRTTGAIAINTDRKHTRWTLVLQLDYWPNDGLSEINTPAYAS